MITSPPPADATSQQRLGQYLLELSRRSHGSGHRFAAIAVGYKRGGALVVGQGVNVKFAALDAIICAEMVAMASLIRQGAMRGQLFFLGSGGDESCGTCLQLMTEHACLAADSAHPTAQIDYFDAAGQWVTRKNLQTLLPQPFLNQRRAGFRQQQQANGCFPHGETQQDLADILQQLAALSTAPMLNRAAAAALLASQAVESGLQDGAVLTGLLTASGEFFSGIRLHPGGPYAASSVLTALATMITARGADTAVAEVLLLGAVNLNAARHLLRDYEFARRHRPGHRGEGQGGETDHDSASIPVHLHDPQGQLLASYALKDLPLILD
jgi:cytidine deaminase